GGALHRRRDAGREPDEDLVGDVLRGGAAGALATLARSGGRRHADQQTDEDDEDDGTAPRCLHDPLPPEAGYLLTSASLASGNTRRGQTLCQTRGKKKSFSISELAGSGLRRLSKDLAGIRRCFHILHCAVVGELPGQHPRLRSWMARSWRMVSRSL